jgi:hypothetical protein
MHLVAALKKSGMAAAIISAAVLAPCLAGEDLPEFKIKREETYEFTEKPTVTRSGDSFEIRFAAKANCDVTVAVEHAGKIVRHLASGILGSNAPAPLQKNSLKQVLTWDGKDDRGKFVDDLERASIRVSLGLKASFERVLNYEPKRRHGRQAPLIRATSEGVYVYDGGNSHDFVKLFDHQGNYVKTVYPFPASGIGKVQGLQMQTYPQDGKELPRKPTFLQNTFLTCGNNYGYSHDPKFKFEAESVNGDAHYGMYGNAATFFTVGGTRVVFGDEYLARMATDGTSGGVGFEGPRTSLITKAGARTVCAPPRSAALSPDGKTLYLTGYNFCHYGRASNDIVTSGAWDCFHAVMKMNVEGDQPPELFAGKAEAGKHGNDDGSFRIPISVATDSKGRVYVADFMNDRVQVFDAAGKLLRKISVKRPARVSIPPGKDELYVFSWLIHCKFLFEKPEPLKPRLTRFGSLDDPKQTGDWELPAAYAGGSATYLYSGTGVPCEGEVDATTSPPTVWLALEWGRENVMTRGSIAYTNIKLFALEDKKLVEKRDFAEEIKKTVARPTSARYGRMRLYANEASGKLYVGEGQTNTYTAFKDLIELDPDNGAFKNVALPFDAEDMYIDSEGLAYLRTLSVVGRFDMKDWREVPWDYGDEMKKVCTSSSSDRREGDLASGLLMPSNGNWHHGGMYVSPKGLLTVVCGYHSTITKRTDEKNISSSNSKSYTPKLYPGRNISSRAGTILINVYDRKGKVLFEDAAPGMYDLYGIGMDAADKLYILTSSTRMLGAKRYPNAWSGTLVKMDPSGRVLTAGGGDGVPLSLADADLPKRPADVNRGGTAQWLEGAEWMYGGVGFCGKNSGNGCACHNTRFILDSFARSFAPEVDRYKVAVLDGAGNLIMRIGGYGNADSAGPASREKLGGDEVGLMHGAYVATHTDRRLYIADPSNDRIVSVKLDYHAGETVPLKSMK